MTLIDQFSEFDTAEISDALDACGIEGALLGIKPILPGKKLIGFAFTVRYAPYKERPQDFKSAGNYIDDVPASSVVIIDNQGRTDCTTWGSILTQTALMRCVAGTVVHGAVRDVDIIRELQYPLYASAIYMRSGKNRVCKDAHQCELVINKVRISPGDVVMADNNGVVIIPQQHLSVVLSKAQNVKETETTIVNAIRSGMTLLDARRIHRYDQPWLTLQEKGNSGHAF